MVHMHSRNLVKQAFFTQVHLTSGLTNFASRVTRVNIVHYTEYSLRTHLVRRFCLSRYPAATRSIVTTTKAKPNLKPWSSTSRRPTSTVLTCQMSDDASYSAFLEKANEKPLGTSESQSTSTGESRGKFDPTLPPNSSTSLPPSLKNVKGKYTYTSDTDSDFEVVFFSYSSDKLPDADDFKEVLGTKGKSAEVERLDFKEFDPQEQYGELKEKVSEAGDRQGVVVFRVELDHTRVEYYILTVGDRKLVGVAAKAVES